MRDFRTTILMTGAIGVMLTCIILGQDNSNPDVDQTEETIPSTTPDPITMPTTSTDYSDIEIRVIQGHDIIFWNIPNGRFGQMIHSPGCTNVSHFKQTEP